MFKPWAFLTIAHSSLSQSLPHGTQCEESWDYSNDHTIENGDQWPGLFQCCLARMAWHGEWGLPDKTSQAFESRNEMAARQLEFSKLARCSDTLHTFRLELIIHITKSLKPTFGVTTRAHPI